MGEGPPPAATAAAAVARNGRSSEPLTYRIGPVVASYASPEPELRRWAEVLHVGHEHDGPAHIHIELGRADDVLGGPFPPEASRNGHVDTLRYVGWEGLYDDRVAHCTARLSGNSDAARGPRRIATLTRTVVSRYLLGRGGLALHAAAMARDGAGYLFAGPSGAGKTTLVRTWPGDVILGDDYAIVAPGAAGGFRVYGTPYTGREGTPNVPEAAPLAGIFILEQSDRTVVEPLDEAAGLFGLVPSVIHFGRGRDEAELVLSTLTRLAGAVGIRRLCFNLVDSVWDAVLGEDGGGVAGDRR